MGCVYAINDGVVLAIILVVGWSSVPSICSFFPYFLFGFPQGVMIVILAVNVERFHELSLVE